jgi:hypothetical protein
MLVARFDVVQGFPHWGKLGVHDFWLRRIEAETRSNLGGRPMTPPKPYKDEKLYRLRVLAELFVPPLSMCDLRLACDDKKVPGAIRVFGKGHWKVPGWYLNSLLNGGEAKPARRGYKQPRGDLRKRQADAQKRCKTLV